MTGTMIEKRRFYVSVLGWFLTFISISTIAGSHTGGFVCLYN